MANAKAIPMNETTSAQWYYALGSEQHGPVGEDQMLAMMHEGRLWPETMVWTSGMEDWIPLGQTSLAARMQAPDDPDGPPHPPPDYGGAMLYWSDNRPLVTTLMEAVTTCFSKYVTFSGRANRYEYWYYILFVVIVSMVTSVIDGIIFGFADQVNPLNAIWSLATLLPSIAVLSRRLHDIGRSAWWILIVFVPLVGIIVLLVFACTRGDDGPNQYG